MSHRDRDRDARGAPLLVARCGAGEPAADGEPPSGAGAVQASPAEEGELLSPMFDFQAAALSDALWSLAVTGHAARVPELVQLLQQRWACAARLPPPDVRRVGTHGGDSSHAL